MKEALANLERIRKEMERCGIDEIFDFINRFDEYSHIMQEVVNNDEFGNYVHLRGEATDLKIKLNSIAFRKKSDDRTASFDDIKYEIMLINVDTLIAALSNSLQNSN